MADSEAIMRYMRQIAEAAARFEEDFDSNRSHARNTTSRDVMSSRVSASELWAGEPAHQERGANATNIPPTNDWRDASDRSTGSQSQRDVTREVSEALGHELSIQRRMRGL